MKRKLKDIIAIIREETSESMTRMEAFNATTASGRADISWEMFKRAWSMIGRSALQQQERQS